jgi:hypothetical protein
MKFLEWAGHWFATLNTKFKRMLFRLESHVGSVIHLGITLVGTLFPSLVSLLFLLPYGKQNLDIFWQNGEFYLYSAALSTQAIYVSGRTILENAGKIKRSLFLVALSVVLLVVSSLCYMNYLSSSFINSPEWPFSPVFLLSSSAVLFLASIFLFYSSDRNSHQDGSIKGEYEEGKQDIVDGLQ